MVAEHCRTVAVKFDLQLAMSAHRIEVEDSRLCRDASLGKRVLAVPEIVTAISRARAVVVWITMLAASFCTDNNTQGYLRGPAADMIWHISLAHNPGLQAAVILDGNVRDDVLVIIRCFGFDGLARLFRRGGQGT